LGAADAVDDAMAAGVGKVKEYAVDPLIDKMQPAETDQNAA
jgi:hypothetical protein